jgi:DNA processing protein
MPRTSTLPAAPAAPTSHDTLKPGAQPEASPRLAWLTLMLTPGLGSRRILQAVDRCGSPEAILRLTAAGLEAQRFPPEAVQAILEGVSSRAALEEAARLRETGGSFLTYEEENYPDRLREIFDPPPVLWTRGDQSLLAQPGIAIVGTRHPSPYGAGMAEMLGRELAARGLLVQSGMARGIDTSAHKGALAAGRPTLAVWGTGIDVIYPKENKTLAENIVKGGGLVISEQPLGTYPMPANFPKRNRILSAISLGVLVVEAAEDSGSRVTARCAIEQNRDVYAVPGNVTNKNAWVPNSLIKQGAKLVATWEDVWDELPSQVRVEIESRLHSVASEEPGGASLQGDLPPVEQRVMELLRHDESLQLDELMEHLDGELSSSEVFTALFELELAGKVRQLPGKHYVKSF